MNTFILFSFTVLIVGMFEAKSDPVVKSNGRQKRLLFYDEEGNLVKTYKNPYLYGSPQKLDSQLATNSLNPFINLLRPTFFGAYVIPVSDEVIQQYFNDPVYQNKLLTLPRKDLVMKLNPFCSGLRTQLPSKDCGKFWNCWDGWSFEQECPEGLVFSSDGFCDYPHNVDCSKRFTKPLPSTPSQQSPVLLPQLSLPTDQPQQGDSPPSPQPQIPTQPIQPIEPGNQPSRPSKLPSYPPIAQPPQPISMIPSQQIQPAIVSPCSKDYQAFRNEQECSEFFVCVDSVPIKFKCPADLLYNQDIGVCDYSYRVKCKITSGDSKSKPGNCASPANEKSQGDVKSSSDALKSIPPVNLLSGSDVRSNIGSNAVLFSQNWTSTHVAISRQDAVRQLKLGVLANVSS